MNDRASRSPTEAQIAPGETVGVFGGGQLGRMFVQAAQRMGYRTSVYASHPGSPAGLVADEEHIGLLDDRKSVAEFAKGVAAATLEFENLPTAAIELAAEHTIVRPGAKVLYASQHRLREKGFLQQAGAPVGPFAAVSSLDDLHQAVEQIGLPAVLKTAQMGYDGKGQWMLRSADELTKAWETIGPGECILEGFVHFTREASVIVARGADGQTAVYGPIENHHENHILDYSLYPAPATHEGVPAEAARIGRLVAEALDAVGVLCVELFELEGGELLVNEIAPRPHNSGHLTIEGCASSQFEQQARALVGAPLGSPESVRPAAMANVLGDLWENGEPDWKAAEAAGAVVHLYGKEEPRVGRKMGHLTLLADSAEEARDRVLAAREAARS